MVPSALVVSKGVLIRKLEVDEDDDEVDGNAELVGTGDVTVKDTGVKVDEISSLLDEFWAWDKAALVSYRGRRLKNEIDRDQRIYEMIERI